MVLMPVTQELGTKQREPCPRVLPSLSRGSGVICWPSQGAGLGRAQQGRVAGDE